MEYGSGTESQYSGNSYVSQQDIHSTYSNTSGISCYTNAIPSVIKCDYCANTHRLHLVKCITDNCNRYFCNNRNVANTNTSHIISHLKNANHNFIEIDSRIKGARHLPKCDICGSRNIFSLGFFGNGKNLICRVPCLLQKKDQNQRNFQPLVIEDRLVGRLFLIKNKSNRNNYNPRHQVFKSKMSQVTLQEIKDIELQMAGFDLNELPLSNPFLKIRRRYQNKEEYIMVFQHLINLESSEEAIKDQRLFYREIQLYFDDTDPQIKAILNNPQVKTRAMFYGYEIGCKFTDKDNIILTNEGWDSEAKLINKESGKFIIETLAPMPQFIKKVNMHAEADSSVSSKLLNSLKIFQGPSLNSVVEKVILGLDLDCSLNFDLDNYDFTANGRFLLNSSQIRAIKTSLLNQVSIIHGPPGTGKTKTIVALIYHLKSLCNPKLLAEEQKFLNLLKYLKKKLRKLQISQDSSMKAKVSYYQKKIQNYECLYEQKFQKNAKKMEEIVSYFNKKSKILVCAPSNFPVFDLRDKLEKVGLETVQVLAKSKEEEYKDRPGTLRYLADKALEKNERFLDNQEKLSQEQKKNNPDPKKIELLQNLIRKEMNAEQKKILQTFDIICCTCITSSNYIFQGLDFDFLIVDEATQALEPEIITCLLRKAKHLVLVGDKYQLGSMIMSKQAKSLGYDVSMIERFEDLGVPYTMLSMQYRMDPRIANYSNSTFYENKIESFHEIKEFPNFQFPDIIKSPLFFYHVGSFEELAGSGASFVNRYEAEVIVSIIRYMKEQQVPAEEIGVITFYDGQKGLLIQYLETHLDNKYAKGVEVMSVDASQGREKGFIILSCVRSNSKLGVGFLSEYRRLNVAMTRAMYGLVVCGNCSTLLSDPLWTGLIKFFDDQGLVFSGPLSNLRKETLRIGQVLKMNQKRPNKYADD